MIVLIYFRKIEKEKKMKRLFAIMLCLALCLSMQVILKADDTIVATNLHDYEVVKDLCWLNEELYMLGSFGVYKWTAEKQQPKLVLDLSEAHDFEHMEQRPDDVDQALAWDSAIQYIFTDETHLISLHPYSGILYRIIDGELCTWETMPDNVLFTEKDGFKVYRGIKDVVWQNDKLYLLLPVINTEEREKYELVSFDPHDQSIANYSFSGLQTIYRGKKGNLLAEIKSSNSSDEVIYAEIDVSTSEAVIGNIIFREKNGIDGVVWCDQLSGYLYSEPGMIYLGNGRDTANVKGYIPTSFANGYSADCSDKGLYAYSNGAYVFIRNIYGSNDTEAKILNILGSVDPNIIVQFSIENPDIAVIVDNQGNIDEKMLQTVFTHDDDTDIYISQVPGAFASLKDKGFASSLSQSERLTAKAREFYPEIQKVLFQDGELLAYPLTFSPSTWTLNIDWWNKFDLGDYPLNYEELTEDIAKWVENFAEDNPDYVLFDNQQDLNMYVTSIIKEYILQNEEAMGEAFSFNTDEFKRVMMAVIKHKDAFLSSTEYYGMPILSSYYQGFGVFASDGCNNIMIAPPAFDKNDQQLVSAQMDLLIVNPASDNIEKAIRFIEFCADSTDITMLYMMCPGLDMPVRSKQIEKRLSIVSSELEELERSLESVADDKKESLLLEIQNKTKNINYLNENVWEISSESIENYKEIGSKLHIPYRSQYFKNDSLGGLTSIISIVNRFCDQGLDESTLSQMIAELDHIVRMMHMESM